MNKALQKWAEGKVSILKKWSQEYDKICKAEGIRENPMVSFALDRDYVGNIYTLVGKEDSREYLMHSKSFSHNHRIWH